MRLWHQDLIPKLPRQQLLGQHRECCALRGNGWGKKHATVNYVFSYPYEKLVSYHKLIMQEMTVRGYKPNTLWLDPSYRGKNCLPKESLKEESFFYFKTIYREHDDAYLKSCIENLKSKGVVIE